MAHIQKTVTYNIPDEWQAEGKGQVSSTGDIDSAVSTALGKTSTQDYDGPETLILWIIKEPSSDAETKGHIFDCWDKDDYTEQPVPLNLEVAELHADTDENTIKIGILFGGFSEDIKLYEIRVGPSEDFNPVIRDPSDPRIIFSEDDITADWTKPLVFMGDSELDSGRWADADGVLGPRHRQLPDGAMRGVRNSRLDESDSKVPADMPSALKKEWETYRQKLRDIPQDWAAVPNHFIKFPVAPDGEYAPEPENDDEVPVIMVSERTAEDNDAIGQLIPMAGIDETESDLL